MRLYPYLIIAAIFLGNKSFSQSEYTTIRAKLPSSTSEKEYYVQMIGNKYVLNGDIIVGEAGQRAMIYQSTMMDSGYIWPKGYVPVRIDRSMQGKKDINQKDLYSNALDAIEIINDRTNIRITPYTSQRDYIRIMYTTDTGYGGISPIGRRGGEQIIYITRKSDVKTIVHEMLHSLGFWHEQSRYDRDQYVSIDTSNVDKKYRHNFQFEPGTPQSAYDYASIMHYPANAFAINKSKPTIRCKNGNVVSDCVFGDDWVIFSTKDIEGINRAYWFNGDVAKKNYYTELGYAGAQQGSYRVNAESPQTNRESLKTVNISRPIEKGVYMIRVKPSSRYLDITDISKDNRALLQQWDKLGGDNQKFEVTPIGTDVYLLKAVHSGKFLNVTGQSKAERATVNQWDYVDQANLKFYIRYGHAAQAYYIQGVQSGLYLKTEGSGNGEKLIQTSEQFAGFVFEKVAQSTRIATETMKTRVGMTPGAIRKGGQ